MLGQSVQRHFAQPNRSAGDWLPTRTSMRGARSRRKPASRPPRSGERGRRLGPGRQREVGEAHHPPSDHGIEGPIDQDADALPGRRFQGALGLEESAGLEEVHGQLQHAEVMVRPPRRLRGVQHAGKGRRLGVGGGGGAGVRRRAIDADAAGGHLGLEEPEGLAQAAIEVVAERRQRPGAAVLRIQEELLGVVEETRASSVARPSRPRERPSWSARNSGWGAVLASGPSMYFTISGKGRPAASRSRAGQVPALHIADLGDHHDLLARERSQPDEVGQHLTDQPLAAAIGVVGRGVEIRLMPVWSACSRAARWSGVSSSTR